MSTGLHHVSRHNGLQFAEHEEGRIGNVGKALNDKSCLMFIKGDWVEFCERLAFPAQLRNKTMVLLFSLSWEFHV